MMVYRIVVETDEPGAPYPIVIHTFQGKDRTQAESFLQAHRKSDRFFDECYAGVFASKVPCRQRETFRGWVKV